MLSHMSLKQKAAMMVKAAGLNADIQPGESSQSHPSTHTHDGWQGLETRQHALAFPSPIRGITVALALGGIGRESHPIDTFAQGKKCQWLKEYIHLSDAQDCSAHISPSLCLTKAPYTSIKTRHNIYINDSLTAVVPGQFQTAGNQLQPRWRSG